MSLPPTRALLLKLSDLSEYKEELVSFLDKWGDRQIPSTEKGELLSQIKSMKKTTKNEKYAKAALDLMEDAYKETGMINPNSTPLDDASLVRQWG